MTPSPCRRPARRPGGSSLAPALAGVVLLIALVGEAGARAIIVKDHLCGLFDAQRHIVLGAFGMSTLAPNGVLHLVCHARVPPPGVTVRIEPAGPFDLCGIEGNLTSTWEERISPSGEAILECWVNPGKDMSSE